MQRKSCLQLRLIVRDYSAYQLSLYLFVRCHSNMCYAYRCPHSPLIIIYEFAGDGVSIKPSMPLPDTSPSRLNSHSVNGNGLSPMIPPLSPRGSVVATEQPHNHDIDQPRARPSMDYSTTWKDLPLHEEVTKPEPVAKDWPRKGNDTAIGSAGTQETDIGDPPHVDNPHASQPTPATTTTTPASPTLNLSEGILLNGVRNGAESDTEKKENELSDTLVKGSAHPTNKATLSVDDYSADVPPRQRTPSELRALGEIARAAPAVDDAAAIMMSEEDIMTRQEANMDDGGRQGAVQEDNDPLASSDVNIEQSTEVANETNEQVEQHDFDGHPIPSAPEQPTDANELTEKKWRKSKKGSKAGNEPMKSVEVA